MLEHRRTSMTDTNTSEMNSRTEKFEIDDTTTDISRNALLRPRARLAFFARSPPPRTTFAAILFLITGSIFLILGLLFWFKSSGLDDKGDKGLAFIVLGSLMFIPGSYASLVIYGTMAGWPNYDFSNIPSYDD